MLKVRINEAARWAASFVSDPECAFLIMKTAATAIKMLHIRHSRPEIILSSPAWRAIGAYAD
jgi:hypothetical protein